MERGHAIPAFVLAGWQAAGCDGRQRRRSLASPSSAAHGPRRPLGEERRRVRCREAEAEDPPARCATLRQLCGRMQRGQRLSIVDLVLYNWKVPADEGAALVRGLRAHRGRSGGGGGWRGRRRGAAAPGRRRAEGAEGAGGKLDGVNKVGSGRAGECSLRGGPATSLPVRRGGGLFSRLHVALASESGLLLRAARHRFDATSTSRLISALHELSGVWRAWCSCTTLRASASPSVPTCQRWPESAGSGPIASCRSLRICRSVPTSNAPRVAHAQPASTRRSCCTFSASIAAREERGESGRAHAIGTFVSGNRARAAERPRRTARTSKLAASGPA